MRFIVAPIEGPLPTQMAGDPLPAQGYEEPVEIAIRGSPQSFGPRQFRIVAVVACLACSGTLTIIGLGWIPALANRMGPTGEFITFGTAAFLVADAIWAWILFGRVARDRADRVQVSTSDIRISFAAAPDLVVSWSDPSLILKVTRYSADSTAPLSFQVKAGRRRAYTSIRSDSLPALARLADLNRRVMEERINGKPPRIWTVWTLTDIKSESLNSRSS